MKSLKISLSFFLFLAFSLVPVEICFAKDSWTQVRSTNFNLIGNASEKEIKNVGTRLEQYREVFSKLLPSLKLKSPIPITVIVFKNADAYKPFKPVRGDGKISTNIAGYFLKGQTVNYITLSAEGEDEQTYRTIFHEYTHYLVGNTLGKSRIPPWFNEGLAEYYETFKIEGDQKVILGGIHNQHLNLLSQNRLIPLDTFFNIDNYSLHQQGNDGVGLFYAQAWALMHYLIQGNKGARLPQMSRFLQLVMDNKTPKQAFLEAFQTDYQTMEKELKKYVEQNSYQMSLFTFRDKLVFDQTMQSQPITDSSAESYLGDLLYNANRLAEAEKRCLNALQLKPDAEMALTTLGLIKMRQKNFPEAKKYLETALRGESSNYYSYFNYAYVLSREEMSEHGFITRYNPDAAEQMRAALKKSIELNPQFPESYNLYAFISIVRNENLDEALNYLNAAVKLAPGDSWHLIRMAEIYLLQKKFAEAKNIAGKVAQTADEQGLKIYAENTVSRINSYEAQLRAIENYKPPKDLTDEPEKQLTPEEIEKIRKRQMIESMNEALRKPEPGEKRILGYLTKIECAPNEITFVVKSGDQTISLQSDTFDRVNLMAFEGDSFNQEIGCGSVKKDLFAVVTYRPSADAKLKNAGQIVSLEFVPANFQFIK